MKYGKIEHVAKFRRDSRSVYEFLQKYVRAGCTVCLEGKEALPDEIATACLRENMNYMMDFVPSEDSPFRISRIDFTKIRGEKDEASEENGPGRHANVASYEGWCS
jgi:hypothetical protein